MKSMSFGIKIEIHKVLKTAFKSYTLPQVVLGQEISRPTILDQVLAQALLMCQNDPNIQSMLGSTLCAEDFYEGGMQMVIVF